MSTPDLLVCLYQDEHLYAIHKPAGINFHCTDDEQGIVRRVKDHFAQEQLYPVHRLDKMTSGIMIFARSSEANTALSKMFAAKSIEKYYLAISASKPVKKQGSIIGDMEKARRGSYMLTREKKNPAITRFFTKSFLNQAGQRFWFFVLKPETGKTHQLRVALKSIASPALGDERYGPVGSDGESIDRGYLHAYKMRFDLFGKRYELQSEHFNGQYIEFSTLNDIAEIAPMLQPEKLTWPKGAFLLSTSA